MRGPRHGRAPSHRIQETSRNLPSPGRLLVCAMLIPVVVAVTNQLLLDVISTYHKLSVLLYPWLALSTAVLSWSTGRYLYPAWLRWTIFAWGLVLLDLLTFIACITTALTTNSDTSWYPPKSVF